MDFTGNLEHRLEAYTLLSNIAIRICLGAFADRTNSLDICFREPILVRINDNAVLIYAKTEPRGYGSGICNRIVVIFRVLDKFVDKASVFSVEIRSKTVSIVLTLSNIGSWNQAVKPRGVEDGSLAYVLVEAPSFRRTFSSDLKMCGLVCFKNSMSSFVKPPFSILRLSINSRASCMESTAMSAACCDHARITQDVCDRPVDNKGIGGIFSLPGRVIR